MPIWLSYAISLESFRYDEAPKVEAGYAGGSLRHKGQSYHACYYPLEKAIRALFFYV